jgi:4-amino-4-deoxy-L-arabinose transferase-like glycosyltransferase
MNSPSEAPAPPVHFRSLLLFISLLAVALFAIRITAPSDLLDYAQEWPTSYVLDVIHNGHWLVQTDVRGEVTSKPPLYTWLAAGLSRLAKDVNRLTLTLPAFFATWATALIILLAGRKFFGARAGFLAALVFLLSPTAAKQVALVRTDGLFSFTVGATALLVFRAWRRGGGWTWCWLAAAVATLTKGPLGVLLAGLGLLAVIWERRTGNAAPLQGSHWLGVILWLALAGGWFAWAYGELGRALSDRMLVRELAGRAISKGPGSSMGAGFYLPTLYFLSRFAPWSLLALVGFWRVLKRPAADATERRFERFLFCWFVGGLLIFSVAAHQRPDLIFPLVPPAALLAGHELARFFENKEDRTLFRAAMGVAGAVLVTVAVQYRIIRMKDDGVAQTLAVKELADSVRAQAGGNFPLVHVDTSPILQMHLGTACPLVPLERALQLLRGNEAAFVVVRKVDEVLPRLNTNSTHILAEAPPTRRTHMAVLGNRPKLAWTSPLTTLIGRLRLEMSGVKNFRRRADEFWLENESPAAYLELTNESNKPISVRVHFTGSGTASSEDVVVPPGETRKVICP